MIDELQVWFSAYYPAELPRLVGSLLLLSLVFLGIAVFLFVFILFRRIYQVLLQARRKRAMEIAQQLILSFLFSEKEWEKARIERIRKRYLLHDFHRQIFLDSLIGLKKNLLGDSAERLQQLYYALNLHLHSAKKLASSNWSTLSKGIHVLAEMEARPYAGQIRGYLNHAHPIVRSEAQLALIKLEQDTPFSFLNFLKEPLSPWQQVQLAMAAENLPRLPTFERWLRNPEPSVVIFCIRMIAQNNQYAAAKSILSLLAHPFPPPEVRLEIFRALRLLLVQDAEGVLLQLYPYEPPEIQQEIAKTLQAIGGAYYQQEPTFENLQLTDKLFA